MKITSLFLLLFITSYTTLCSCKITTHEHPETSRKPHIAKLYKNADKHAKHYRAFESAANLYINACKTHDHALIGHAIELLQERSKAWHESAFRARHSDSARDAAKFAEGLNDEAKISETLDSIYEQFNSPSKQTGHPK